MSSDLRIISFAETSRDLFRNYSETAPEPCFDCDMPPECSDFCSPFNALTAQCTNQCVVVACSDPDHGQAVCENYGSHNDCDDTADCTDCTSFDAFVSTRSVYHNSHSLLTFTSYSAAKTTPRSTL